MRTIHIALLSFILSGHAFAEDISLGIAGWEKTQAGDHKGAIELFKRCIAEGNLTKTALAQTYRNIGIALRRDGRPSESIEYYEKSMALKPEDIHRDYVNRGNAYSECKEYDKALSDYAEAQKFVPDYNEAYFNRGIVYERQNKNDEAVEQFKLAYKFGLRSELLYDRFVAHGLIEAPKTEEGIPKEQGLTPTRSSHVVEFVGIENFAQHTLSIRSESYNIVDATIQNWSKGAGGSSGSIILPGPMPLKIETTLVYDGKTYHDVFEAPKDAKNKAALYELSWNLKDGSHSWGYSSYKWQYQGLAFEAQFSKDGAIDEISIEQSGNEQRTVSRYKPVNGSPERYFLAIIYKNNAIHWVDFSKTGEPTAVIYCKNGIRDGIKMTLDPSGTIISAHKKLNDKDDYSVNVEVTKEMASCLPAGNVFKAPEIKWDECLAYAHLSALSDGTDAHQGP